MTKNEMADRIASLEARLAALEARTPYQTTTMQPWNTTAAQPWQWQVPLKPYTVMTGGLPG